MKIVVLASGSKGNSTYIEHNNTKILIDFGVSSNYVEKKLKDINVDPKEIDLILITHTHSDHIAGLNTFIKKYDTTILISPTMEEAIKDIIKNPNLIYFKKEMNIDDNISIKIIKNSHDIDSYGFIINEKVVYITDTGYINSKHFKLIQNKEVYIIESNHDVEMLMKGRYPHYLKQRILSDKGHLSNEACGYYLSKVIGNKTKYIILAHLSEENNTSEKALEELNKKVIDDSIITKLNERKDGIVFVLWGNAAREKKKLITNNVHKIVESAHPSPLSYDRGFKDSKPFSKINSYLISLNKDKIKW